MVWVDNTRIIAMFAVVWLHVAGTVITKIPDLNSNQWLIVNFYEALVRWCVPVFVMLSGGLLLADDKIEPFAVFYRKRTAKLVIPLLFWSVFFLALTYAKGVAKDNPPSLLLLSTKLLSGRPYYHLWFLYMISGLYFVTPLIRILFRNSPRNSLNLFILGFLLIAAANSLQEILHGESAVLFFNLFLYYLPYFMIGYLISTSSLKPDKTILALIFTASATYTAVGCALIARSHGIEKGLYFFDFLSITVIPMSISAMFLLKELTTPILVSHEINAKFAGLVLGIYLIHPAVIDILKQYDIHALSFNAFFSVPLISILVFTLSAIIAEIIHLTPYLKRVI